VRAKSIPAWPYARSERRYLPILTLLLNPGGNGISNQTKLVEREQYHALESLTQRALRLFQPRRRRLSDIHQMTPLRWRESVRIIDRCFGRIQIPPQGEPEPLRLQHVQNRGSPCRCRIIDRLIESGLIYVNRIQDFEPACRLARPHITHHRICEIPDQSR
jgi:hypothetical protein